jgi:hypothetical protein
MSTLPADIAAAGDATSVTLQVAFRQRDTVVGGHLNVARDALAALRDRAQATLADLEPMERRDYWPDANLQAGEYYEIPRAAIEDSLGVLRLLDAGADTQLLAPEDLAGRLLFYSVVVGADPARRVSFVSKSNPARELGRGIWLTRLTPHSDTLTSVETPLFLFEDRVDLVVGPENVVVMNQLAFEQWFRESPAIGEHVQRWIGNIHEHLPLADDGVERLRGRAETNSRIRRLLRNISERGHLAGVSIERIRAHILQQGLEETTLLRGEQLLLGDDPTPLLKLLNEDLFRGGLTDVPFVSDNKAPRN